MKTHCKCSLPTDYVCTYRIYTSFSIRIIDTERNLIIEKHVFNFQTSKRHEYTVHTGTHLHTYIHKIYMHTYTYRSTYIHEISTCSPVIWGVSGDDVSTYLQGVVLSHNASKTARNWVRVNFSKSDYAECLPARQGVRMQRWWPTGELFPRFQCWYPPNQGDTHESKTFTGPNAYESAKTWAWDRHKKFLELPNSSKPKWPNVFLNMVYVHIHMYDLFVFRKVSSGQNPP